MRIIKLTSENVKRISAIAVTPSPDGSLVTVGGKNGAGKSSVLDSIAYALGGEKLVPTEPIRIGEREAKVIVDLGDYIVTRRFYRDHLDCDCPKAQATEQNLKDAKESGVEIVHATTCASHKFGPTKSTLTVTNQDGAKYPAPQVLLDKLYGKLTFDPLAFSKEKPSQQNEILRRLTNLDFSLLNAQRKVAFDRRAMGKKTLAIAQAKLANMPKHDNVPTEEIPIDEVSAEVKRGQELRKTAEEASLKVGECKRTINSLEREKESLEARLHELQKQMDEVHERMKTNGDARQTATTALAAAEETFNTSAAEVPDFQALDKKLRDVDTTNKQVRDNAAYRIQEKVAKDLETEIAKDDKTITDIDTQKAEALRSAKFPVEGLGLTDDGVTFEGLPLGEVSSSVQLNVSIAIGLALNPTLKVLLIRNGNLLDDDSVKQVAEQAATAGAQVWMEYVTSHADGVSVMLEDGHLA